ncbi:MAG: hypothetical protein ACR2LI_15345 [Propionibacteriaceae bacterium]
MKAWRIGLATAGVLALLYGAIRLFTQIPVPNLIMVAAWMIGAVIIHDGVLSPLVVAVGWALRRWVPDRGRRHLQAGLIIGALVTVIAVPMIYLRDSQPAIKAILLRPYGANLTIILGIVAVLTLAGYAVRVAEDRAVHPDSRSGENAPAPDQG